MLDRIKHDVVKIVLTVQVRTQEDVQAVEEAPAVTNVRYQHADYEEALAADAAEEAAAKPGAGAVRPRRRKGRPQRSVSVRLGQEIQAVPRPDLTWRRRFAAHRSLTDACPLHARPTAEPLLPVPGVRSAPPRRGSRTGNATTCCWSPSTRARPPPACSRKTASARRRSRSAASILPLTARRHRSARADRQCRQRQRRHRRARDRRRRGHMRRGGRRARLRAGRRPAVLDRRDHGAAAGGEDRRRAAGREGSARARSLVRRGVARS